LDLLLHFVSRAEKSGIFPDWNSIVAINSGICPELSHLSRSSRSRTGKPQFPDVRLLISCTERYAPAANR
jgi:hypothetical protein